MVMDQQNEENSRYLTHLQSLQDGSPIAKEVYTRANWLINNVGEHNFMCTYSSFGIKKDRCYKL